MKRILIINPFGIGDVLFTTPLVRAVRSAHPKSYIGYLCNKRTEPVLINNLNIDELFIFEKDDWRALWRKNPLKCIKEFRDFLKRIKKRRFELAIDLSLGRNYSFFSWLLGIPKRVGFNYKNRGIWLTDKLDIPGYENKHVVEHYLDLLNFIGLESKELNLEIFLSDKDRLWADKFLNSHAIGARDILVGIVPAGGASWGNDASIRHWPAERFAQLAERLVEHFRARIIIFGDLREKDICQEVMDSMQSHPINAAGKTTLMQLAALLHRCNLVIANEGGPLHLAIAAGTKTISIFGPVDEKAYGPYPSSRNHITVKKDLACRPCHRRFRMPLCKINRECINSITVDEVFEGAERLLS